MVIPLLPFPGTGTSIASPLAATASLTLKANKANQPDVEIPTSLAPLLEITYKVQGAGCADVVQPPNEVPLFTIGLWDRLCFELFLKPPDCDRYWEWNISPHGAWACFEFSGYRQKTANCNTADFQPRGIQFTASAQSLELRCAIPLPHQVISGASLTCDANLSLVLPLKSGNTLYCAWHHAPDHPDFHNGWAAFRLQADPRHASC